MKLKASVDYGVRAIMYLAVKGTTCSSREIPEEMKPRKIQIAAGEALPKVETRQIEADKQAA